MTTSERQAYEDGKVRVMTVYEHTFQRDHCKAKPWDTSAAERLERSIARHAAVLEAFGAEQGDGPRE